METHCPECGAIWNDAQTCQDHFYQMGYWEMADLPHLGVVHHLMVLSYHLQHPSLYSPDGLTYAKGLLVDFVARGITPQQARQQRRDQVDSGQRTFKIVGTPELHGRYDPPVAWTLTTTDVIAGGTDHYVENVTAWAQSIYDSLQAVDQL